MILETNRNFKLFSGLWGIVELSEIADILDCTINEFYAHLDRSKIPQKQVFILNSESKSPPTDYPEIVVMKEFDFMYLNCQGEDWGEYVFQFSSLLSRHVADSGQNFNKTELGWLKESLYELAPVFTISEMNIAWEIFPPHEEWIKYAVSLKEYSESLLEKIQITLNKPFHEWYSENIKDLKNNKHMKHKNLIIASYLFPIFRENPMLWQSIQDPEKLANILDLFPRLN